MSNDFNAVVRWEPRKRTLIKPGLTYTTASRLVSNTIKMTNPWSMVVQIGSATGLNGLETFANVHFLFSETAPNHLLARGAKFELYEGSHITGIVTIL